MVRHTDQTLGITALAHARIRAHDFVAVRNRRRKHTATGVTYLSLSRTPTQTAIHRGASPTRPQSPYTGGITQQLEQKHNVNANRRASASVRICTVPLLPSQKKRHGHGMFCILRRRRPKWQREVSETHTCAPCTSTAVWWWVLCLRINELFRATGNERRQSVPIGVSHVRTRARFTPNRRTNEAKTLCR